MRKEISLVQRPVVEYARNVWGITTTKGTGFVGMNDYIFWMPGGRVLLMEFKDPKGVLSDIQSYWVEEFRKEGYDVEVCDNAEIGKGIINDRMVQRKPNP